MGVRRAGVAARNLLEICSPRILISFGIAGAVEADLQVGDVIAAEAVCLLEHGIPGPLLTLASWPDAAFRAASQALSRRGARLFTGTAVTTNGSQVTESQLGKMVHPILEMETAGILQAAAEKGIPLLTLRAISDGPRAPIPFDLSEIMDGDANLKISGLLKTIVRHPRILFQTRRMMQNTRIAADNAAIALLAALRHSSF
jgi:nucleoside phosphorylase